MPTDRFRLAADSTELFLYFIVYCNINARYKNNEAVIDGFKASVDNMSISAEDKTVIKSIIDGILKGELKEFVTHLTELFSKNVAGTPNDILGSIKHAIASFFKKIIDYFDNLFKILSGEKEFPRWD